MAGRDSELPHSLVPLNLAVTLVKSRLRGATALAMDNNAVANFIAATVPIYEYWDGPARPPQTLPRAVRSGFFREGGRELRFVDGRPPKQRLAIWVEDVSCVVEMLQQPERALHVRNQVLRALAKRLRERSRQLVAQSEELRTASASVLYRASSPAGAGADGAATD